MSVQLDRVGQNEEKVNGKVLTIFSANMYVIFYEKMICTFMISILQFLTPVFADLYMKEMNCTLIVNKKLPNQPLG